MAHWRKVDTRIWGDARFVALSDDAKLAFLFLLTHPRMTSMGAMRGTILGLASELEWEPKRFEVAFRALPGVLYDEDAPAVGLRNFLRYNPPESPNVVRSWGKVYDEIPEGRVRQAVYGLADRLCRTLSEGFREAFAEAFGKPSPTPSESLPEGTSKPSAIPSRIQSRSSSKSKSINPPTPLSESSGRPPERSGTVNVGRSVPDAAVTQERLARMREELR